MAREGQYAYARTIREQITDPKKIIQTFLPYRTKIEEGLQKLEGVRIKNLDQVIISVVKGEQKRLLMFPKEFRHLIRSCSLSEKGNNKVINTIYRRLDDLMSILLRQEAPMKSKFYRFVFSLEGELKEKSIITETQSWAFRLQTEKDSYIVTYPMTLPLQQGRYLWIPCLVQSLRNKGHLMIMAKEEDAEEYYLFDPNARLNFIQEVDKKGTPEIIEKIFHETIKELGGELVKLEHVALNHTPKMEWHSFDQGQCGSWCLLLAQMTEMGGRGIKDTLKHLEEISIYNRAITIYSYSTMLSSVFHGTRYG